MRVVDVRMWSRCRAYTGESLSVCTERTCICGGFVHVPAWEVFIKKKKWFQNLWHFPLQNYFRGVIETRGLYLISVWAYRQPWGLSYISAPLFTHRLMDGQSVQILEDMLRACILDFGGGYNNNNPEDIVRAWHLSLVEFAYNNSYQASIQMALFETAELCRFYTTRPGVTGWRSCFLEGLAI